MNVVLRLAYRRTSWEALDVQTILDAEFRGHDGQVDLRPSVYVLESRDRADIVQTHAEHAASFCTSPPNGGVHADLNGLTPRSPVQSEGTAKFAHARQTHHEVILQNEDELRELIGAFLASATGRRHNVSRNDLLDYANERWDMNDLEWRRALAEEPGQGWATKLKKRRDQRARESH